MLRAACLLSIAAQLVLLNLLLRPTGRSAIWFTFLGNPLLAASVVVALLWVLRIFRRIRRAHADRVQDRIQGGVGGGGADAGIAAR